MAPPLPPSREWLLPFHREILHRLVPEDDELRDLLVILAPGLGLRRVVATLMRAYAYPQSLVLLVNASSQDVQGLNHDLGTLGLHHDAIQDIHYEMSARQRSELYMQGGLISVTSQILVVDMLTSKLPTDKVTGLVVLHAERITPTSLEAFLVRLYRERNRDGFLKAFSDRPEHFAAGFSTLQTAMGQLRLRQVDLWPRFHQRVDADLGHRRADVIELHQALTPSMRMIQNGIIECLEATLDEIQRSKLALDIEEINVESALHRAFDVALRRQLDPVWHRLSPAIKQLVGDLGTLRQLLFMLLSYDPVSFYEYLETILSANHAPEPGARAHPSPWLMSDAANTIFREARARLWLQDNTDTVHLVLEEPPKWTLLLQVLDEIEQDLYVNDTSAASRPILIMVDSDRTCAQLRALLASRDDAASPGRAVLAARLREYVAWTSSLGQLEASLQAEARAAQEPPRQDAPQMSEALQRKAWRNSAPPPKRRRVRGGLSASPSVHPLRMPHAAPSEPDRVKAAVDNETSGAETDILLTNDWQDAMHDDQYFGIVDLDHVVVIHRYQGDDNESLLQQLRPRYVITYDPNAAFVRQLELYRALHRADDVRIYFLLHTDSVEEQMYLAGLRREKDAFERLIRLKGTMALPLTAEGAPVDEDAEVRRLHSLRTRVAGGQRPTLSTPPTVVVDMREFRSSLPSLLHAAGLQVVPCTLQVGDYVISSDICIERKSLTDLVQSLNSGRLYTQCEAMSMHYAQPVLLIEFDQDRAFTFEIMGCGRLAPTRQDAKPNELGIQAKLVLLTLTFPRLRLIWSSSPYASVDILAELKQSYEEPDAARAAAIGLDDSVAPARATDATTNLTPMDMLRAMPGVTAKNALYLARVAPTLAALCQCSHDTLRAAIGAEPARRLYAFLHHDPASIA